MFDVPVPTATDPRYGQNTAGRASEAGESTGLSFAMTKQASAAKQARVIDFLPFLTSRESNAKFSKYSGWLPAVVGVQPLPAVQPFLPRMQGYPPGFTMGVSGGDGGGSLGTETGRVQDTNMYRLFEPDGGVQAYTQAIADPMRPAVISDFNTINRDQLEVIVRQDTTLGAYGGLSRATGGGPSAKVSELDELQTQEEIAVANRRWQLGRLGVTLDR